MTLHFTEHFEKISSISNNMPKCTLKVRLVGYGIALSFLYELIEI